MYCRETWISDNLIDLNVGNQRHSRIDRLHLASHSNNVDVAIIIISRYLHSSPGADYYFPFTLALVELQVRYSNHLGDYHSLGLGKYVGNESVPEVAETI